MAKLAGQKRRYFRDALELRLRRAEGARLQKLAARILERIHGDNFVPQCPWGDKGDLSCDGYLRDPATVFACYGRENGVGSRRIQDITAKVRLDFDGATRKWPRMKRWMFVTNIVDGVPAPVTSLLEGLNGENGVETGYIGFDRFERMLLDLDAEVVEDLIDEIPVRDDFIAIQPEAVVEAAGRIARAFSLDYLKDPTIAVPEDKLVLNSIPSCHAHRIREASLAQPTVAACISQNADPMLDARLADAFRTRYLELRVQSFGPDEIMDRLYELALAGSSGRKAAEQATAWALLAYFFGKCTIFEDKPRSDAA